MTPEFATYDLPELKLSPTKEDIKEYFLLNNIPLDPILQDYFQIYTTSFTSSESPSEVQTPQWKTLINDKLSKIRELNQKTVQTPMITPNHAIVQEINELNVSDEDKEFLTKMAIRESGLNPLAESKTSSAKGLYQFLDKTREHLGLSLEDLKNTKKQHMAALILAEQNERTNKDLFQKYVGTEKDGVLITYNGLRAVHALLGAGGTREWLEGGTTTWTAQHGHKDKNGTGPATYLKLFI
jgi:hypothetical protein